jgi:hypothetical protein
MLFDRILSALNSVGNILSIFDSFQEGTVTLQASGGTEVVEIKTRKPPVELWISIGPTAGIPVCQGNIDKFSYSLTTDGFILYANISSNTAQLNWHAIFENK